MHYDAKEGDISEELPNEISQHHTTIQQPNSSIHHHPPSSSSPIRQSYIQQPAISSRNPLLLEIEREQGNPFRFETLRINSPLPKPPGGFSFRFSQPPHRADPPSIPLLPPLLPPGVVKRCGSSGSCFLFSSTCASWS